VYRKDGDVKKIKKEFLSRNYRGMKYELPLLNEYEGMGIRQAVIREMSPDGASLLRLAFEEIAQIKVNVAAEFFAKEPWPWVRWWVNFWFRTTPRDQCQFRKRKIFPAFSIQPIPVFIWMVLKLAWRAVVVLWLLLLGKRGIDFRPLISPFRARTGNIYSDLYWSVFTHRCYTDTLGYVHHQKRAWWVPFFSPLCLMPCVGLAFAARHFDWWEFSRFNIIEILLLGLLIPTAIVGACSLLAGIIWLGEKACQFVGNWFRKHFPTKGQKTCEELMAEEKRKEEERRLKEKAAAVAAKERDERFEREFVETFMPLSCVYVAGKPVTVASLPTGHKTVHLRFLDLKAKVCKRFASHR